MKATQKLHDIGQSLWLDNITRGLLTSGTLRRYRDEFAVTGLTSNPTIFDHALRHGTDYDAEMRGKLKEAGSPEELFFALALTDLRQAADLFQPIHDRTGGVDGCEGGAAQLLHQDPRARRRALGPSRSPSSRACRST